MTPNDTYDNYVEDEFTDIVGDQYDSKVEYIGGSPSPRNVGWYKDLAPVQRYVAYIVAYMSVAQAIIDANNGGDPVSESVTDETKLVMAFVTKDQEAIDAGLEAIKADSELSGMVALHDMVFGDGNFAPSGIDVGFDLQIPKMNTTNIDEYAWRMSSIFADEAYGDEQTRVTSYSGQYYKDKGFFLNWGTTNIAGDPGGSDLFDAAYGQTHGPDEEWKGYVSNVVQNATGLAVDAMMLRGAGALVGAAVPFAGRGMTKGLMKMTGGATVLTGGKSVAGAIVKGLMGVRSVTSKANQFRKFVAPGIFVTSTATYAASLSQALFASDEMMESQLLGIGDEDVDALLLELYQSGDRRKATQSYERNQSQFLGRTQDYTTEPKNDTYTQRWQAPRVPVTDYDAQYLTPVNQVDVAPQDEPGVTDTGTGTGQGKAVYRDGQWVREGG